MDIAWLGTKSVMYFWTRGTVKKKVRAGKSNVMPFRMCTSFSEEYSRQSVYFNFSMEMPAFNWNY